ncbi:MAG: ubiquinol-cytochrome c reductase iron-sulfur subunit, partial [Vulcanimicrobiaceae bacterium]
IAILFPLRTFGQSPKGRIGLTNWRKGVRLVREDGTPLRADQVEHGSAITAFAEGHTGADHTRDMGLDAVVVMHVGLDELELPHGETSWAPEGYIAYSKICTHLGCPLGLYRAGTQQLMCPCHQSTFNVLDGGQVIFGPAARSLPMLPLQIDRDGTLRAAGYMSDYVGPDNWDYGEKWDRPRTRIQG